MRITDEKYFEQYFNNSLINDYNFSDKGLDFEYQTQASAVCSSNIEGNYKPEKEIEEIEKYHRKGIIKNTNRNIIKILP